MTEHSILPPSRAARRMACPGSRLLESEHRREESESAKEGTLAHEIAARYLILKFNVKGHALSDLVDFEENEMLQGARILAACIEKYIPADQRHQLSIEKPIDISIINANCWGTPDVWCFDNEAVLHIFDYKYGHSYVDAFQNWQMIEYSAGIIDFVRRQMPPNAPYPRAVHFHIVQPRCYIYPGENNWYVSYINLLPLFDKLRVSEKTAMRDDAQCRPSPQCKNCDASHVCQALQLAALSVTETATENTPNTLSPFEIGNELRVLHHADKLLKARINGLEQHATTLLKSGKNVNHFSLEPTRGREVWKIPADKVKALGIVFEKDLTKPTEVITPNQALRAGIPASLIRNYSERVSGVKLTEDDGTRARKIFGGES